VNQLSPSEISPSGESRTQAYVVWTAILASSMVFADGAIVTVAIPQMRESLQASLSEMQWISNAYALTLSAFLLDVQITRGTSFTRNEIDQLIAIFAGIFPEAFVVQIGANDGTAGAPR